MATCVLTHTEFMVICNMTDYINIQWREDGDDNDNNYYYYKNNNSNNIWCNKTYFNQWYNTASHSNMQHIHWDNDNAIEMMIDQYTKIVWYNTSGICNELHTHTQAKIQIWNAKETILLTYFSYLRFNDTYLHNN